MKFRELKASEIDCRIQSIGQNKAKTIGATILLYKDARVDMNILDETVGAMNWQRGHSVIDGNLYCTISIWDETKKQWVTKSDVGTESNTEKEKGQASDSFKRAGFNWGIGRELYTAPFVYITLQDGEWYEGRDGKPKSNAKFKLKEIAYDESRNIVKLIIVDSKGKVRYTFGENTQQQTQETVYNWQTLKARATQGGISEEELVHYVTETFKVSKPADLKQDHYQQAFNWVNAKRYAQR
nr:MAG TPA: Rad52/22 family double-strand break repair protein [Caudoviricetes sp.]